MAINLDLFGASVAPPSGGVTLTVGATDRLSAVSHVNPADRLREEARARFEAAYIEDRTYKPKDKKRLGHAGNYTTSFAAEHARKLGWSIIAREQYDTGAKRHYDIVCGLDLLCVTTTGKLVGIQAAGKGERAEHYRRFEDRRGPKKAAEKHMAVEYWVFTRDSKTPIEKEVWVA